MPRPNNLAGGCVVLALAMALGAGLFVAILVGGGSLCTSAAAASASQPAASGDANSIPANYLALYKKAGQDYGIPWNVLAGIGKVESDHGRGTEAGIHSGANPWGAMGPMQFLADTWATYGVDGDGDGKKDVYDPVDAIPGAANYLKASGAPGDLRKAIYAYNHSWDYVNQVLADASKYAAGGFNVTGNNPAGVSKACVNASPAGYQIPGNASERVKGAIAWALQQLGTAYYYGGDCSHAVKEWVPTDCDCSSLMQAAYEHVGVHLPRTTYDQVRAGNPVFPFSQVAPGDLLFVEPTAQGPGHVGMYMGGGQVVVAPHTGAFVRIEQYSGWVSRLIAIRRVA